MTLTALSKSESTSKRRRRALLRTAVVTLMMTLTFLALGAGYGRYRFGSLPNALAALRGECLLVDEPLKTIDGVYTGSKIDVQYRLTNVSEHPIRVVGMASSCSCTGIENLPLTLVASETRAVTVRITIAEGRSDFSGTIRLFTDDLRSAEISLAYSVRVIPAPGTRSAE